MASGMFQLICLSSEVKKQVQFPNRCSSSIFLALPSTLPPSLLPFPSMPLASVVDVAAVAAVA